MEGALIYVSWLNTLAIVKFIRCSSLTPLALPTVLFPWGFAGILFLSGVFSSAAAGLYPSGSTARAMSLGGTHTANSSGPLEALCGNPAALAAMERPMFELTSLGGFADAQFHNRSNPHAEIHESALLGSAGLGFLAGPVRLGLGVTPEIARRGEWTYRDTPGGADGFTSYGVRPHESEIALVRTSAGAALALTPTLSLGADVGLLYNRNRLYAPYIFQSQPTLKTAKTLLDLQTDGLGWDSHFGVLWKPQPAWSFGLSYATQSRIESHGSARGNAGVQLKNLGLGGARPDFQYDARVINVFPQKWSAGAEWRPLERLSIATQLDWIHWSGAFDQLAVRLRNGNNRDLNQLVGSDRLNDDVPLQWRDQWVGRLGLEYALAPEWALRAGYAYGRNPVPARTLTPLTAAITEHTVTAGLGFHRGGFRLDLAWQWELPATASTAQSALAAGEYSQSTIRVSTQWIALTSTVAF